MRDAIKIEDAISYWQQLADEEAAKGDKADPNFPVICSQLIAWLEELIFLRAEREYTILGKPEGTYKQKTCGTCPLGHEECADGKQYIRCPFDKEFYRELTDGCDHIDEYAKIYGKEAST